MSFLLKISDLLSVKMNGANGHHSSLLPEPRLSTSALHADDVSQSILSHESDLS